MQLEFISLRETRYTVQYNFFHFVCCVYVRKKRRNSWPTVKKEKCVNLIDKLSLKRINVYSFLFYINLDIHRFSKYRFFSNPFHYAIIFNNIVLSFLFSSNYLGKDKKNRN